MLETTWFVLWGILWAVYFMLDGFDLGLGSLTPFLAKNDTERRIIYNSMGPFWDGNEVWLITAGGVTFAAFPKAYAVLFSSLYSALMLLLFALILRGVSFEFRGKVDSPKWRAIWDSCVVIGSFLPALLLGVAFANIFRGIPIDAMASTRVPVHPAQSLRSHGWAVVRVPVPGARLVVVDHQIGRGLAAAGGVHGADALDPPAARGGGFSRGHLVCHPALRQLPEEPTPLRGSTEFDPLLAVGRCSWSGSTSRSSIGGGRGFPPASPLLRRRFLAWWGFSQPASVQLKPGLQCDHLQCGIQPLDTQDHAGGGAHLRSVVIAYQAWVYYTFKDKVREEDLAMRKPTRFHPVRKPADPLSPYRCTCLTP